MNLPNRCPRCDGSMETGAIVDHGYGITHVGTFQAGEPKVSKWFGLKEDSKAQYEITARRCSRCGYIEQYAINKSA